MPTSLMPPTTGFAWPTIGIDLQLLAGYLTACEARGIQYGLGSKADGDGRPLTQFPPRYAKIDCSGWVRAAIAYATHMRCVLPDGSYNQHDWCAAAGLKVSSLGALSLLDGILRIAFIVPTAEHPIGHVFLCRDGRTMESWGEHGPGSRSVLTHVLQAETSVVYVLEKP